MKKTFVLNHPKIKYPRLIEGVKHDLRKYLKRERRKTLPDWADFWDFDCRFGDSETESKRIHLSELDECINEAEKRQLTSFYVEVLAKPACRAKKSNAGDGRPAPDLPKLKTFGGS
ncbi:MAG: hypothetical protein JXR25_03400 [Pontiellaceae bacterium]|nr:hypothetical protein [Pontiellaceae bacterium]MBN2783849.1 hypothetical protein [Pontiellaceae bacterium]